VTVIRELGPLTPDRPIARAISLFLVDQQSQSRERISFGV